MAACPSEEVVAALVHNALPDDEAETLRNHVDICESCAELVAASVRAQDSGESPRTMRREFGLNAPLAAGSRLGRYEIRGLLGVGGMGHVYEANDRELERAVALKVLRPELEEAGESFTERLVRESRLMAKITDRAVIAVYDVGRDSGRMFIAMELVRGETLGAYLARVKPPWRRRLELFERAGHGLAAAHRAGVVHRDFKPENVLVETDDDVVRRVVVTDFGIARTTLSPPEVGTMRDIKLTADGTRIGTPAYMAPEQLAGKPVDHRADVFSFAASVWEALFGTRPFMGSSVDEILRAYATRPRAPRNAPLGVVHALQRGLTVAPEDRWSDMTSFVRQLARVRTRRRALSIGVGVAALALVGFGGVALALRSEHVDRCTHPLRYDVVSLYLQVRDVPPLRALDASAREWRETHRATCRADAPVIQEPAVAACLAARELEIVGAVEALIDYDGAFASEFTGLVVSPRQCAGPEPVHSASAVPAEPALRRAVSSVRRDRFALDVITARGDPAAAIGALERLVERARMLWPPLHAEIVYALGETHAVSGNAIAGATLLREAAALAESVGVDRVAVRAWILLAQTATSDEGDPRRGLEYLSYAEAALERYTASPDLEVYFLYAKGGTLAALGRTAEAAQTYRRGLDLALEHHPALVYALIYGLAYVQEIDGRHEDAVVTYRRALATFATSSESVDASNEALLRGHLAENLLMLGRPAEAEPEARKAAELAERYLTADNIDRALAPTLVAYALYHQGRYAEALAVVRPAKATIATVAGVRSPAYAQALLLEANITRSLDGDKRVALTVIEAACALLPLTSRDAMEEGVKCALDHVDALLDLGKHSLALSLLTRTGPTALAADSATKEVSARFYTAKGIASLGLGKHADAIASLERGLALLETSQLDPGRVASTRFALAQALWSTDNKRAQELAQRAVTDFDQAPARWASTRRDAVAWLASHPRSAMTAEGPNARMRTPP